MGLKVKSKSGTKAPLIPEQTAHAICYGVVELGTQATNFGPKEKVVIFWELPDERMDFENDKGETVNAPRVISNQYTAVIHEKSNLGKLLVSWRGKPFTEEERDNFDLFSILGQNCLLSIIHNTKGEDTYANVDSVVKLMKGMEVRKAENPNMTFSFEDNGKAIPDGLYDWVKEIIKKSDEYRGVPKADEWQEPDDTSPDLPEDFDVPF
jgi:hypothetical protein